MNEDLYLLKKSYSNYYSMESKYVDMSFVLEVFDKSKRQLLDNDFGIMWTFTPVSTITII